MNVARIMGDRRREFRFIALFIVNVRFTKDNETIPQRSIRTIAVWLDALSATRFPLRR